MSNSIRALALLAALASPESVVAAESSVDRAPPLEALVAEALERSPALAALRAEVAARRELESPAGALPDPMLETALQNVRFEPTLGDDENTMLGFEARQGVPYPGKRASARAAAVAATASAMAELSVLERHVAVEIGTLYARLYAVDREAEALAAAGELVDLLGEVAQSRYATGSADQEGVLKAQLRALRISESRGDLASERLALVAELNRWLDRAGNASLGVVDSLPDVPPIATDAESLAVAGSAEVALAEAALAEAERRVELARLELKPNFSVGAGFATRGGLDPLVIARLGVELPFWRRQKQLPRVRAAELQLEAARRQVAEAEAMARAEAARLRSMWANADQQVSRYREGILPLSSAALDAARATYLTGRGDFSTVIENFNLWLEVRIGLARREADAFSAHAAFVHLAGTEHVAAAATETP